MRLIITISFLFSIAKAQSVYHIKNGGSDGADGLTDATAWASVSKIRTGTYIPGDSILLKRGDTWNDSIRVYQSGTLANPIYIGAYGTGVKPEITGFQSVTMSSAGGNVYTGTITNSVVKQNTVLINDTLRGKARYPNWGVLSGGGSSHTTTYLKIPHSATNYVGRDAVIHTREWEIETRKIVSQNNGVTYDTLNLASSLNYSNATPYGYFFQNSTAYLDSLNEYSYDSATKLVSVYASSLPTVRASTIDTLITAHSKSYITIENLTLSGANISAFWGTNFRGINIKNCVIKNSGADGIMVSNSSGMRVTNDTLINIQSNAFASDIDTSIVFEDNYVKNIGVLAGMGRGFLDQAPSGYTGFFNKGHLFSIQRNKFYNVGYMPIFFQGGRGTVMYNLTDSFCFVKIDGGGIYTWQSGSPANFDSGTIIKKNIVRRGGFGLQGVPNNGPLVYAIYLDQLVKYVTVDSNYTEATFWAIYKKGSYNTITNNTINANRAYNRSSGIRVATFDHDIISGNIIYSPYISAINGDYTNIPMYFDASSSDANSSIDYNVYLKLLQPSRMIYVVNTYYSLAEFQVFRPTYNIHSIDTIPSLATSSTPTFIYNNTNSDSTFSLGGYYIDVMGVSYSPTTVLKPFQSKMLFPYSYRPRFRIGKYKPYYR